MDFLQRAGSEVTLAVIASAVIVAWLTLWKRALRPLLERFLYRDLKLAGTWDVSGLEEGRPFREVAEVTQSGHRVKGVLHYEGRNSIGGVEKMDYVFDGEFANTILTASHWSQNRSGLDRGGFTLKAETDDKLVGCYAWHLNDPQQEGRVICGDYIWVRRR